MIKTPVSLVEPEGTTLKVNGGMCLINDAEGYWLATCTNRDVALLIVAKLNEPEAITNINADIGDSYTATQGRPEGAEGGRV